jgi:hypothetical protein
MPKLNELIKKLIDILLSLLTNIAVIIFAAIVGVPTLIAWVTGTLDILLQSVKSPTPLWVTIILTLALLTLYIYPKKSEKNRSSNTSEDKTELIKAGKFLWQTTYRNNLIINVSKIPFCSNHKLRLVETDEKYQCQERDCKTSINNNQLMRFHKMAISFIEREVMQKS